MIMTINPSYWIIVTGIAAVGYLENPIGLKAILSFAISLLVVVLFYIGFDPTPLLAIFFLADVLYRSEYYTSAIVVPRIGAMLFWWASQLVLGTEKVYLALPLMFLCIIFAYFPSVFNRATLLKTSMYPAFLLNEFTLFALGFCKVLGVAQPSLGLMYWIAGVLTVTAVVSLLADADHFRREVILSVSIWSLFFLLLFSSESTEGISVVHVLMQVTVIQFLITSNKPKPSMFVVNGVWIINNLFKAVLIWFLIQGFEADPVIAVLACAGIIFWSLGQALSENFLISLYSCAVLSMGLLGNIFFTGFGSNAAEIKEVYFLVVAISLASFLSSAWLMDRIPRVLNKSHWTITRRILDKGLCHLIGVLNFSSSILPRFTATLSRLVQKDLGFAAGLLNIERKIYLITPVESFSGFLGKTFDRWFVTSRLLAQFAMVLLLVGIMIGICGVAGGWFQ